jgi:hypothetical protein
MRSRPSSKVASGEIDSDYLPGKYFKKSATTQLQLSFAEALSATFCSIPCNASSALFPCRDRHMADKKPRVDRVVNTTQYAHMASFSRRRLICFGCNKRSSIKYDGRIRQWECAECKSTNYLDEVSLRASFRDPRLRSRRIPETNTLTSLKLPANMYTSIERRNYRSTCCHREPCA